MTITEKVSYLKGLADGLKISSESKEGEVIRAIIDALEDIAFSVSDLEDGFAELCDQVDMIDEDLDELEEIFYDDDDDYEYDGVMYEVECPSCGEHIHVDEEMVEEGEIHCPSCNEHLEFTFDDDDEDED